MGPRWQLSDAAELQPTLGQATLRWGSRVLYAPLPLAPAPASVLDARLDHRARVEDRNQRQTQTPERRETVEAHDWPVAKAHQHECGQTQADQRRIAGEQQHDRQQVGEEKTEERCRERQVRMTQLSKGRARNLRADLSG